MVQARQAGTQTYKTTCFPFWKAGGFLCWLRLLPQALANNTCSGTQSSGPVAMRSKITNDRKTRSPPGWAAISHLLQTGQDGMVAKKRIQNDNYELYEGRHEAIITQEQWDLVKAAQAKRNHTPVNIDRQLRNPFVGVLFCGKCGGIMKRNIPNKKRNPTPWYRCNTRGCDCRIMKCETVETALCDAMEEWLDNYIIQLETKVEPTIDPIDTALEAVRGQLSALQDQQENICEYLEKGIYTIDMFTKRNLALAKEIKQLQESEEDLLKQKNADNQQETIHAQIIPAAQHILESYPLLTVEEKNRLWKLVLKKATIYRSPDDEVVIRIYPNLPK